jgi:nickel transport protein
MYPWKRYPAALFCAAGFFLAIAITASAHGMNYTLLESSSAIAFQAQFSGGEPMSYSEVIIVDSEGKDSQTGMTDKKGCFAFVPEKTGEWHVVVNGGMGHRLSFDLEAEAKIVSPISATGPQWLHALVGVSLIFNLCFVVALARHKQRGL